MFKRLLQCLGFASLILVMNYVDLLGGGGEARLHAPAALKAVALAQLTDIVALGLIVFAILAPLRAARFYPAVRLGLAYAIPPYLILRTRYIFPVHLTNANIAAIAGVWAVVLLLLWWRLPAWYRRFLQLANALGVVFGIFAVFSAMQLLYITLWKPGPQQHTAAWSSGVQPARRHARVVWIVFDELSYDQLFEHRAAGLSLSQFDALRAESTVFSNAQPIGDKTVEVLPSLLSGAVIDRYRFTFYDRLMVHTAGVAGLKELTGAQSIFAAAQQQGWRTAVVGWYNPYCTIFAGAIDDCYWNQLDSINGPMGQDKTYWQNAWLPLRQVGRQLTSPAAADRDACAYDVQQRITTIDDLKLHVRRVLQQDQADLIFLHLPIPHSPGVWDRRTNSYTQACGRSYVDNLALADAVLGEIRNELKAPPRWNDTTLIVQGDHSWRVAIWNWLPPWTAEDSAASHNRFDPRPAVFVHLPGQTQAQVVAAPWSLLKVHDVVELLLRGAPVNF